MQVVGLKGPSKIDLSVFTFVVNSCKTDNDKLSVVLIFKSFSGPQAHGNIPILICYELLTHVCTVSHQEFRMEACNIHGQYSNYLLERSLEPVNLETSSEQGLAAGYRSGPKPIT